MTDSNTSNNNELITVATPYGNTPKLTLNPQFEKILGNMKELTADYHKLVDNVNLDQLNEDEIDNLTKQLAPMQSYYKEINQAKKSMRQLFNHQRDQVTKQLDDILKANGMDQLTQMDATKKQLRRDLLNHRANRRWKELQTTFNANFDIYPNLKKFAKPLSDFGDFRINHANLVSGAKNAKITDKQRSYINNTINEWNQDLQSMIDNTANLPSEYRGPLLNEWIKNPEHENYVRLIQYYQEAAKTKAEKLKALSREKDVAKVKAAKLAIAQHSQPNQESLNINGEFNWLLDIAFANPNTHNITKDDAKASLIIMLSIGMTNQQSPFYQHIGTDYEKMLRAIRYIMSR